ncbi:MAG: YfhO family protein [Actinomycetota bacterium]|nr:YfhO family protein [Actinomycetota bacterium]
MDGHSARTRRVLPDASAIVWLLVSAAGFLAPALSHGKAIGPYDLLKVLGLTSVPGAHVHNAVASDQIQQFIPWQVLSWRLVHAGIVPLWQPANLLGMPLAWNFQSAPFGLANAVGYAFPLALAHSATIATELVVAGTGTYVLCRMLALDVLPSAMGATIFELCGAFTVWLGVYEADVCMLLPWALAASVALIRRRRKAVPTVLLALVLALAFAAGEPQIDVFFILFVAVFAVVVALGRGRGAHSRGAGGRGAGGGSPRRALLAHLWALVAAAGLVAPIYLPAGQVLTRSARVHGPYVSSLPPHDLTHLLFVGYSGVPTNLTSIIGVDNLYVSMVYVGSVGLVLALVGLVWIRRRPEVLAFLLLTVVLLVVLFAPPVAALMRHIPEAKVFRLDLGTTFCDFGFAMLAAFGAQALVESRRQRTAGTGDGVATDPLVTGWTDRLLVGGTVFLALALAVLEIRLGVGLGHLRPAQSSVRQASFLWPTIGLGVCALVAVARLVHPSARAAPGSPSAGAGAGAGRARLALARSTGLVAGRGGLVLLVGVQAAYSIIGGAWFLSSTPDPLPVTPAIAALSHDTAGALVGMGTCPQLHAFPGTGIMPDVNATYGIDELVDYDPIMTTQYYAGLGGLLGTSRTPPAGENALFCPKVSSVRTARFFGASYVLEPPGAAGPPGTTLVATIRGERLYAVPGSGRATLVALPHGTGGGQGGTWSSSWEGRPGAPAVVQPARESEAGTWRVRVDAHGRSLLVLRVTAVPGWHATIDGRPLDLRTYDTLLLAAVVPPGRHVVVLHYWPSLFSVGLYLAAAAGAALAGTLGWALWVGRRRRHARGGDGGVALGGAGRSGAGRSGAARGGVAEAGVSSGAGGVGQAKGVRRSQMAPPGVSSIAGSSASTLPGCSSAR